MRRDLIQLTLNQMLPTPFPWVLVSFLMSRAASSRDMSILTDNSNNLFTLVLSKKRLDTRRKASILTECLRRPGSEASCLHCDQDQGVRGDARVWVGQGSGKSMRIPTPRFYGTFQSVN